MNPITRDAAHIPQWVGRLIRDQDLPPDYASAIPRHVAPLGRRIAALREALNRPVIIGIAGAQGTGKSTLASFLGEWLRREQKRPATVLSLDDVYLGRAARQRLAGEVHPLLATRGVPGTHDPQLAQDLLTRLTEPGTPRTIRLPLFDKALDDRTPETDWPTSEAPVDAVLFEGWCVGARPQDAGQLDAPVNELEAAEDPDGCWRRYVNDCLRRPYAALFTRLDALIMLRAPSFRKVLDWRRLQERKLAERLTRSRPGRRGTSVQSDDALARFVMHYERLTRHMLAHMPAGADSVIDVGDDHRLAGRTDRGWRGRGPAGAAR